MVPIELELKRALREQAHNAIAEALLGVQITEALIQLDIVNCRAKHAEWLSATRPHFSNRNDEEGSINISGATYSPSRDALVRRKSTCRLSKSNFT